MAALAAVVAIWGAIRAGQAQSNAANFNSAVAQRNVQISDAQGEAAGESQQRDAARRIGTATAAYGASGVQLADGSPADVLAESARNATLDNLTLKYNYKLRGLGYQTQANLESSNATNARTASYFNAASSALQSGSQMYTNFG